MSTEHADTLTARETTQIEEANSSGRQPVVFVHGLWLLASSWDRWCRVFENAGYAAVAPGWPDDPESVEEARRDPDTFANKMVQQVTDHFHAVIEKLTVKPAVVGHSFGGLIAQKLAGEGASAATVAIDPAPFRGVLPLPVSALKSASLVLANPLNARRAVALTFEEFVFGWVNALPEDEARQLYEEFHVAAAGVPLFQAAGANLNPFSEAKVDSKNPDRGPLLIISGEKDNTVPWAIANASYKRQSRNPGVTEIIELPDRGHSLVIDHGWQDVADTALRFIKDHGQRSEPV
ncbi:MAG: alpha/beta hydrolase [Nocardioidaceae bacterium]